MMRMRSGGDQQDEGDEHGRRPVGSVTERLAHQHPVQAGLTIVPGIASEC
jgi:hypothetical protein